MSIEFAIDDGRDGIEERERVLTAPIPDSASQGGRGEGTGRDDDAVPIRRRRGDFGAPDLDQRMARDGGRHRCRKAVTVHGEGATGRDLVCVARRRISEPRAPHFFVQ